VPLPLLPVLGACVVDCRLSLLVVELVDDSALRAVLDVMDDDDLPGYEAAAM
jgi:hypothetical protein